MSRLARALALAAMLAPVSLAGMTAAQAQATNQPTGQYVRRPPAERQVGEYWRKRPVTIRRQTPGGAAGQRLLARERSSIPEAAPAQVRTGPAGPVEPSGQAGWLVPAIAVLVGVVALTAGAAVLVVRRANRTQRAGQAA
jgi:hypothetical protein